MRAWVLEVDDTVLGELVVFDDEELAGVKLSEEQRSYLRDVGMPEEVAWADVRFGSLDEHEGQLVIGRAVAGDPCCIADGGAIYGLNHDDGFERYEIASSPVQLVKVAALFVAMHRAAREIYGDDDWIPDELFEAYREAAERIDSVAAGFFEPG